MSTFQIHMGLLISHTVSPHLLPLFLQYMYNRPNYLIKLGLLHIVRAQIEICA